MSEIISVRGASKTYRLGVKHLVALKPTTLSIHEGEFLSIVGPSGCGKSTLVRVIAGLEEATHGHVLYRNQIVKGVNPYISMVFQSGALFPWLTVFENAEFGLRMAGMSPRERRERALKYLDMVELEHAVEMYPRDLSGGMRQRVGIARALAMEPEVLLLDEPFSSLDIVTSSELHRILLFIWQKTKKTVVLISHLVEEAVELSDRVVVFQMHEVEDIVPVRIIRPRHTAGDSFHKTVAHIKHLMLT